MTATRAVLFDIDGTLVDSVYLHVDTWRRAFAEHRIMVPSWEIHRQIGKDGSLLVQTLLDRRGVADDGIGASVSERHGDLYRDRADELTLLPGARELVIATAERHLRVVLATSAPEPELAALRDLLEVEDWVDAVTSGEDVDIAKPDATVVRIALQRAGVDTGEALMVGDATWDAIAATDIGVRTVGLRSGGVSGAELVAAGAAAVYDDPADLLADLDYVVG